MTRRYNTNPRLPLPLQHLSPVPLVTVQCASHNSSNSSWTAWDLLSQLILSTLRIASITSCGSFQYVG